MPEIAIVVPIGALLLTAFYYLRSLDPSPALSLWAFAFTFLYVGGVLSTIEDVPLWLRAFAGGLNTLFVGLAFAGTLVFAGRPLPKLLVAGVVGAALLRMYLGFEGYSAAAHGVSIALSLPLFPLGGVILWRCARDSNAPLTEKLLGPLFVLFGVVNVGDQMIRVLGLDVRPWMIPWLSVATAMGLLQILAIYERVRERMELRAKELRNERRTLRAVLETAPLDIFLQDPEGRVTMLNRSAAEHLELSPDTSTPESATRQLARFAQRFLESDRLEDLVQSVERDPNLVIEDLEFTVRRDAGDRAIHLFSGPVLDREGERLGRVWITRDITEARRLEEQLREAQKMETLGTLAGGFAHDFNNQLTTILGNALLARESADRDSSLAEPLRDLERAAQHCAELTRGLLAFARRAPLALRAVDVEPVVAEVERLLRPMLPPDLVLEVQVADDLPAALADPTQLQQVLLNLGINARDAIADRGRIHIDVRAREVREIPDHAPAEMRTGLFIQLEVSDDGVGIDRATRERMFDPFFTTKEVGSGTGLGLAIVYGVVRSHEGWLEVDTEPGRGTRVRVVLPVADRRARVSAPAPAHRAPRGNECLLVADDEARVRRLTRSVLEGLGYSVIEVASGDEAIAKVESDAERIDAAILDLTMPGRDGIETLEALRKAIPGLPALLASGVASASERASSAGLPLLRKPFRPDELGRAVRRMFDEGP